MRRTLATDLQEFGTVKDAQTALRHRNPGTTASIYIQPIDRRVAAAQDARTQAVVSAPKLEPIAQPSATAQPTQKQTSATAESNPQS